MKDILTVLELIDIEFDVNKEQIDNLQFQNGVLMLNRVTMLGDQVIQVNTKQAFRSRRRSDFVTQVLPYDFDAAKTSHISEVENIFKEIQPDGTQRNLQLSWNAYCLTGHTKEQVFKLNVGNDAANGKSTEAKIHKSSFPIYTMKLYQKQPKRLIQVVRNPIRYAYIEGLDCCKLDAELFQDYVNGDKLDENILCGTSVANQAKFCGNSNQNVKACKGTCRALIQHYTSQFEETPDPLDSKQFQLVKCREALFEQNDDFKRAYLWVLLPYIVQYYERGLVVPESARWHTKMKSTTH